MKLFGMRAADYMRAASDDDRRYLLYNPIMKMKVTSQGEKVVGLLHDVIAAKGFEQDTYFEMAIRDIGMLPKLEGTVHVNMALIVKFIQNYFFQPVDHVPVPQRDEVGNDAYLFEQASGGLGSIRFPDYGLAYDGISTPNVDLFKEQVDAFRATLIKAPPSAAQAKNMDFMLAAGELFTLAAYAQLILESAKNNAVEDELLDEIFECLNRDFSEYALNMVLSQDLSEAQEASFNAMIRKPVRDEARSERVWTQRVYPLKDAYVMND
jgi:acyl-CoA dehydrogenase